MGNADKAVQDVLVCDVNLDITRIGTLCEDLRARLVAARPVTLDVSAVARVDTAALQLLTAFVRGARARGITFAWHRPSEAFTRSADRLGLSQELGLAAPPPAGAG
jgi:phospholipid transport system transporter-binding protein